jgi:hypothetical protein
MEEAPAIAVKMESSAAPRKSLPALAKGIGVAAIDGLSPSEQKLLDALALMERLGSPAKKVNLAFFAGYAVAGRFNNLLGGLRTKGFIDYPEPNAVALSLTGRAMANADDAGIRSRRELHATWLSKLSESESKVLRLVIESYPTPLRKDALAHQAGYEVAGRFNNIIGRLRSLGAVDYPTPGYVLATDALFPKGLR